MDNGWMDRWMDGRMDEYVEVHLLSGSLSSEQVPSCPIGSQVFLNEEEGQSQVTPPWTQYSPAPGRR